MSKSISKSIDQTVQNALAHTFNNSKVRELSNEQYKAYISSCCALTLATLIANEGHQFVKEFCEAALNAQGDVPIVQQVKTQ